MKINSNSQLLWTNKNQVAIKSLANCSFIDLEHILIHFEVPFFSGTSIY